MADEVGSGERLRDELRDAPAVGPAAGPGRQPAHDLAEVAGAVRARRGDGLADERLDGGVVELLGKVLGEDGDLRLLLRREVLAGALSERLDRLTPGLHLAGEDRGHIVVAELATIALLDRVDRVLVHPQDVT